MIDRTKEKLVRSEIVEIFENFEKEHPRNPLLLQKQYIQVDTSISSNSSENSSISLESVNFNETKRKKDIFIITREKKKKTKDDIFIIMRKKPRVREYQKRTYAKKIFTEAELKANADRKHKAWLKHKERCRLYYLKTRKVSDNVRRGNLQVKDDKKKSSDLRKANRRTYYITHRERVLAYHKVYRAKNKKMIAHKRHLYYRSYVSRMMKDQGPKEPKAKLGSYYKRHKENIKIKSKIYREQNRGVIKQRYIDSNLRTKGIIKEHGPKQLITKEKLSKIMRTRKKPIYNATKARKYYLASKARKEKETQACVKSNEGCNDKFLNDYEKVINESELINDLKGAT